MYRWKVSFLALVVAGGAWGQTVADLQSDSVRRIGTHISCKCGSCNENVMCMMSMNGCGFCKPAKTRIYKMQKSGMSDQMITASFVSEYGKSIYRPDPTSLYWAVPYAGLGLGAFAIVWFLRRYQHAPVIAGGETENDDLGGYRDRIEKETEKLD